MDCNEKLHCKKLLYESSKNSTFNIIMFGNWPLFYLKFDMKTLEDLFIEVLLRLKISWCDKESNFILPMKNYDRWRRLILESTTINEVKEVCQFLFVNWFSSRNWFLIGWLNNKYILLLAEWPILDGLKFVFLRKFLNKTV